MADCSSNTKNYIRKIHPFWACHFLLYFIFQYAIFLAIIVIVEIAAVIIAAIFKGQVSSVYQFSLVLIILGSDQGQI